MSSYVEIWTRNGHETDKKWTRKRQKILIVVFYVSGITSKEQLQRL